MNWRPLLALGGLCVAAAHAQSPATDPAAAALPPQFEVEVIVFANRDFDPTEERFDLAPNGLATDPLAPFVPAPVFDATTPAPLDETAAAAEAALRIRPLAPSEFKLGNEYRKLRALSAYEPLLHAGWVQPGLPEADAQPFDIGQLGVLNPSGTVRVHLSRFLHITLDLTYQGTGGAAGTPVPTDGLREVDFAPRYRLKATRSARSGELHYFDHPAFGVLVRITPVPAQDASPGGRRPAA